VGTATARASAMAGGDGHIEVWRLIELHGT
jgi:hypothetical protein